MFDYNTVACGIASTLHASAKHLCSDKPVFRQAVSNDAFHPFPFHRVSGIQM
ncbi:hypothetical protein RE6C_04997 [Rhodopirellula europaea 6C]|uniref:Uncharacterized protein n=1 Tax=Rhodopirellula europaea 6C TaxID=1263867 RepID=M2ACG5_9BACT|nr:hypothetical protein RE6C_04997 [Rhodopirellula europaea 6C]